LSIQYKEKESDARCQPRKIIIQPDGATVMDDEGWDVLGMMELADCKNSIPSSNKIDYDKCVLVTAISALAMKRYIQAKDYSRVAIPFLMAIGGTCSLFATTLNNDGNPCVKVVGYPGGHQALEQKFTTASCHARKEIFISLAVLLHQFKTLFQDYQTTYTQELV
jgi:hypothetical protein